MACRIVPCIPTKTGIHQLAIAPRTTLVSLVAYRWAIEEAEGRKGYDESEDTRQARSPARAKLGPNTLSVLPMPLGF